MQHTLGYAQDLSAIKNSIVGLNNYESQQYGRMTDYYKFNKIQNLQTVYFKHIK